ncbi:MAG: oxygen-independent coproporphyrinogen III oxidase-like protein [Candidatus Accumulibacter sp.]|nr:oxygen-independent coproporphyrinogen III oxidase-like protein [Accumulibacter sp.]
MATGDRRQTIPLRAVTAATNPGASLAFRNPPPLTLYIHVPWCVRKCPYCDFNSHALTSAGESLPESEYLAALLADLESALPQVWGRRVDSIFIGGGTPSLLSGEGVDRLLADCRSRLPVLPGAEITLEANPGTVDAGKFAEFRAAGVNRLSLGIQTFDDTHLQSLGRIHDRRQALQAIEFAARHFENFNLDLMYGLPEQTLAQVTADLDIALSFTPPHLSYYQLTIEAHTAFAVAPPPLPDADCCADMQDAIEQRLADAGYTHYETSAFAQAGRQCRHNLNYWQFGDYLGIGAGAHSKLTCHDRVVRQARWKHPEDYLRQVSAGTPLQTSFDVAPADLPGEFMINALRLLDGFDPLLYEQRTALPLLGIETALRRAEIAGLLERDFRRIAPSDKGRRFLNRLLEGFLPER